MSECKFECKSKEDIEEIKKDVKSLLAFKWQALGVVGALSLALLAIDIIATLKGIFK